ncbi:tape measure protein [Phocoenobacter uteri]|uniref:tape measure protein n=1 Tax=Phocoenobacter uteri TaxID=146806 RepID=UPI00244250A7|nr:tape measure protein [Phocoenobacter uteri]
MPGSLGSLNIQLTLDQIKFQNALTKAEQRAQTFSRRTQKYLNNIDAAMTSLNKSSKVTNLLLGKDMLSTLSRGIQTTLRYADANTEVINKLRLVTNGSTALTAATNSVFEIALRTNQELDTTAQIYQRLSQNAETLHLSQERVASITETINKAVAMSGASAASAQAALMQFGQALASGVLRGEEFNSLSDQTPAILDAIAKGLGVTRGELREMAKAGKLTMDVVIPALEKVKDSVDTDFSKRIKTVSQAFTNLETSFVKTIGSFNESIGVTDFLAENIELVAANLEEAIKAAVIFGGVLAIGQLGKYSGLLLTSSINSAKSAIAHKKEAQAIYEQATATRVAAEANLAKLKTNLELTRSNKKKATLRKKIKIQTAEIIGLVNAEAAAKRNLLTVNRLLNVATRGLNAVMGLLGGPAGVVMLAGGALWYFSSQAEKARNWALDTTRANQQLTESYEDLSVAALSLRVTEQLKEIERLNDEVGKARGGLLTSQISTDFEGFTVMGNTDEQEMEKLKLEIQTIKENAEKAKQVLSKMLEPLVQKMKNSGKKF